jgi:hypothetical protein
MSAKGIFLDFMQKAVLGNGSDFIQNKKIYSEVFTIKHRNIELNILNTQLFKTKSLIYH